ncbi:MAG: hypothetical protein PHX08_08025 [Lachnospiraceae bacterium]|nr:hypothetical protein [Lachnospiraceae bacterium]
MCDMELAELVKLAVESLKEKSVYQLLQSDMEYQKKSIEEGFAEQEYIQLDLTEQQRRVCNRLLECRDSQNLDYSTCSYMAGLYDTFRILAILFPEKWDMKQVREAVFKY